MITINHSDITFLWSLHQKLCKEILIQKEKSIILEKEQKFLELLYWSHQDLVKRPLRSPSSTKKKVKSQPRIPIHRVDDHIHAQAFSLNIKKIVKIKENFPNFWTKKIKEVHKVINKTRKKRPKINMISKNLSWKQMLVPMN